MSALAHPLPWVLQKALAYDFSVVLLGQSHMEK